MPTQSRVQTGVGRIVGDVPAPTAPGQVLVSLDGSAWTAAKPVVGLNYGWLNNACGDLLVEGWFE